MRELVRANPELTAAEYPALLGTEVAAVTVWRAVRRLGFTHNKGAPRGRAEPVGRGQGAHVEQVQVSELRRGDVVVTDN